VALEPIFFYQKGKDDKAKSEKKKIVDLAGPEVAAADGLILRIK